MDKEMEVYAENINRMEDDMANKFTRVGELQTAHEAEKQRLKSIRNQVSAYRTGLAKQSTFHAMKHDTRRNMILQNEMRPRSGKLVRTDRADMSVRWLLEAFLSLNKQGRNVVVVPMMINYDRIYEQ